MVTHDYKPVMDREDHMALTPAEKQKRYRERQKLKEAGLLPVDVTPPKLNLPNAGLSEYIGATDPEEGLLFAVNYIWEDLRLLNLEYLLDGSQASSEIARTERAIEYLTTALETLTGILSAFRLHQVDQEIARTKKEDLGDPAKQEEALARIMRLNEVRKHLSKKFRLELSEYDVPSE